MEESSNKVLFIIVGIVAVLLVISFGFLVVRSALAKGNNLTNAVNDKMDNVLESTYTQWEGETVSGTQVLNVINETYTSTDPICIIVVTGTTTTTSTTYCCDAIATLVKLDSATQATRVNNAKAKANPAYITPTGKFLGTVQRNDRGTIVSVTFTQQ